VSGRGSLTEGLGLTVEEWSQRELLALVDAYPPGAALTFRTYHPSVRPREWRHEAEGAAWGLRRDDGLVVTGYGATTGFPEGLLVRRTADGPDSATLLVFPSELLADRHTRQATSKVGRGAEPGAKPRLDGQAPRVE
jgi:hypothetical protein